MSSTKIDALCATLIDLQSQRRHCIKLQSKCDRATEAFVARRLGYHSGLPEKERKKLFDQAAKLIREIEKGDRIDTMGGNVVAACTTLVIRNAMSRAGWDEFRTQVETGMKEVARQLPAYEFVQGIKGIGELGLAVIVGEADDLGKYPNPAKLWKRLGLGLVDGTRQGNPGKNATADDWVKHGYNRQRRAEIWAFTDVLFRHQWRAAKDDKPAHAIGPYGEHYGRKKAEYAARGWTPKHADMAARRYMSKRLIKHLWRAWRSETVIQMSSRTRLEMSRARAPKTMPETVSK